MNTNTPFCKCHVSNQVGHSWHEIETIIRSFDSVQCLHDCLKVEELKIYLRDQYLNLSDEKIELSDVV